MQKYLELDGRTFYAFEEPDFIGPLPLAHVDAARARNIPPRRPASFLERQLGEEVTFRQRLFDWTFGVVTPVICFAADPIVFVDFAPSDKAILGFMKGYSYVLSYGSVMATIAWLLWGARLGSWSALPAGIFTVAALSSMLIAFALLPFSLVGLIVLIGALGLTPFLTSFTYLRNAVRSHRSAGRSLDKITLFYAFMLALLASVVIPYVLN